MQFRDSLVWITGASSGIGEALIAPLAARGARVAISARRADRLEALASDHRRRGADVRAFPLDVTDREANARAVEAIEREMGPIALAVLNAGSHLRGSGGVFDAQQYVDIFHLNVLGVVYGLDAVLPRMLARGDGHIAGVASLAGFRALPTAAAYGASKAALIHLLESIRFDLEPRGVRVTVVNPGFVETPLTDQNRFRMPFLMPVERAAGIIVRELERDRREIHFPKPFSWTVKLLRILPFPLYARVIWLASRGRRAAHAHPPREREAARGTDAPRGE